MITKLVEESQEFYESAASNRQRQYEKDGLAGEQAEVEVCCALR